MTSIRLKVVSQYGAAQQRRGAVRTVQKLDHYVNSVPELICLAAAAGTNLSS